VIFQLLSQIDIGTMRCVTFKDNTKNLIQLDIHIDEQRKKDIGIKSIYILLYTRCFPLSKRIPAAPDA